MSNCKRAHGSHVTSLITPTPTQAWKHRELVGKEPHFIPESLKDMMEWRVGGESGRGFGGFGDKVLKRNSPGMNSKRRAFNFPSSMQGSTHAHTRRVRPLYRVGTVFAQ